MQKKMIFIGRSNIEKAISRFPVIILFETKKNDEAKKIRAMSASGVSNLPTTNIWEINKIGNTAKCIKKDRLKKYKLARIVMRTIDVFVIIRIASISSIFKISETILIKYMYPDFVE